MNGRSSLGLKVAVLALEAKMEKASRVNDVCCKSLVFFFLVTSSPEFYLEI